MEKGKKNFEHKLTQLEIMQLNEQREKIFTNAVFATVGVLDLTLLKLLSKTFGTDDMTVRDFGLLFLGGGYSFLGLTLMGVNAIDYFDMKKEFLGVKENKPKIRKRVK